MIQSNKPEKNARNHVTLTIKSHGKTSSTTIPKETFTSLVTVIKARKCPAKEEKPGAKKPIIKKASERKLLKLG